MTHKHKETNKFPLFFLGTVATLAMVGAGYSLVQQNSLKHELLTAVNQIATKNTGETVGVEQIEAAIDGYFEKTKQAETQAKLENYALAAVDFPDNKKIYGSDTARFTLVTYSDTECPFCKRFHDTPKNLVEQSEGVVNWEWKHLPLDSHNPAASDAAHAAECAYEQKGNQYFWTFIDDVFKKSSGGGRGANLYAIAENLSLDTTRFKDCMTNGNHRNVVQNDIFSAQKLGINGTPATIVVDNHTGKMQLISGAQPLQAFLATIRKLAAEETESTNKD